MHKESIVKTEATEESKSLQRDTRARIIAYISGLLATLAAMVALIGSWQTSDHLTAYVQCQSQWNGFLHRALEARTGANASATAAMDELVNAITDAKSTQDTRDALQKYKNARANQVLTQQQNPLPPPPDEVCEI
jgi:cell division protein FtsX